MLFTIIPIALALLRTIAATPVAAGPTLTRIIDSANAPEGVPVVGLDLGSRSAHGNVTAVGKGGAHIDVADDTVILFLCQQYNCAACVGYDLNSLPHEACLSPNFNFFSIWIDQPSNLGLPYAVYTGPAGCQAFAQVPVVNQCYNANNYVGSDFELYP